MRSRERPLKTGCSSCGASAAETDFPSKYLLEQFCCATIVSNGQRLRVARMQTKKNSIFAHCYVHILDGAAALFVESNRNTQYGSERADLRATPRAKRR